jgi:glucose/arabinose dehydrogenase
MTLDGEAPDDNPIPGSLVFSLGHRNVQGMGWAEDGTMFATEFGQDTWDELNVITAGTNYGWPVVEGIVGRAEYADPVQQWTPDEASPSGMAIVGGTLFLANLRGQVLRSVPLADTSSADDLLSGEFGRLRDAVEAPDGSLWVLTNNTDGRGDPRAEDDRILRIPLG